MKAKMKNSDIISSKSIFALLAVGVLGLLPSCRKDAEPATPATIARAVSFVYGAEDAAKFYTDATETVVFPMLKGQSTTFSYSISPSADELTFPDVVWKSSDEKVMTVENGKITAVGEGRAKAFYREHQCLRFRSCSGVGNPCSGDFHFYNGRC